VQPDIFAVCEMIPGLANANHLLDSAINQAGPRTFARASVTNYSNGDMINMIYFDPSKLVLKSQDAVITDVRDINIYHFYLRTSDLGQSPDTIFLTAIISHLKAGSTGTDENRRAAMTLSLMNYLNAQNQPGNMLVSGDFNFYTSSEQGYQNFLNYSNPSFRFYDPINRPGDWNSNPSFADIHTQSTHSGSNGCAASGGLDDRFDFILASASMMTGTLGMQCITSSYKAVGQDGQHYNLSVNVPPINFSTPQVVLDALYNMSDHLPVVMDMMVAKTLAVKELHDDPFSISVQNPVKNQIPGWIKNPSGSLNVECLDAIGRQVFPPVTLQLSGNSFVIPFDNQKTGLYILRFFDTTGKSVYKKLLVN
ncbi:MAG: hypothetical protein NTU44_13630, partial [Bacteroidetes bacterium]|nr:hypothetical protein [Bacteroidota bacterium]